MAGLDSEPNKLDRLIGRDTAGDPNENPRHDLRMTRKIGNGESCNQPFALWPLASGLQVSD
jgi:hypothetical protein